MAIFTDGPLLEPESKGIDEFHVGLGARLGASAAQTWEDSPVHQLAGISELDNAGGEMLDFGEISLGFPSGPQIADAEKPATPRMDIIEANDRVKKAGLAPHLKLPDQPDIAPAQLQIMMDRARRRHELDTTIERGPQTYIASALDVGTSFLVGAVDPLNLASAFVPVMGELRYGKLLAAAGESALGRATARAGVGAAQGATGQALLEPLDWYSHTQDGRDFGMSDVLHNILFGAVLGGALQAGGGAVADLWRGHKGRPLYPYGPGEPLEGTPQRVPLGPEMVPPVHPEVTSGPAEVTSPIPEVTPAPEPVFSADEFHGPSPEVQTINDLPAQAHQDAMRGAISNLIEGVPVRSGEMLEAAARNDPRIAESFEAHSRNADISASGARQTVFDDARQKLRAAGLSEDEADANAAIVAARYAARAERLGGAQNAVDLYRGENISILGANDTDQTINKIKETLRRLDGLAPEGRAFQQGTREQLRPALRYKNRVFKGSAGDDHLEINLPQVIRDEVVEAGLEDLRELTGMKVGFVDHRGRFLDHAKAGEYAIEHGLIPERFIKYHGSDYIKNGGLTSEMLSPSDESKQKSFFQAQPQAQPFYSAVDRAVTSARQDKATPEQWLGTLKNSAGVKPEEMKWLGIEDWLKEQKGSITRQQMQDYVRANAIEVKEVAKGAAIDKHPALKAVENENTRVIERYGGLQDGWEQMTPQEYERHTTIHSDASEVRDAKAEELYGKPFHMLREFEQAAVDHDLNGGATDAKYPSYTLPGGENYRELLLTLPEKKKFNPADVRVERVPLSATQANVRLFYGDKRIGTFADNPAAPHPDEYWVDLMQRRSAGDRSLGVGPLDEGSNFRSSHWEEPNVLAHIRFDDRVSDGKKTLHLAEVQSDWHQAGKRRGYDTRPNLSEADRAKLLAERDEIVSAAVDAKTEIEEKYGAEFERLGLKTAPEAQKKAFWEPMWTDLAKDPREVRYTERINELNASLGEHQGSGAPDAPFKTAWPELSMKRMIRYAAEHGYDRVSWDTGATNAERYDLSKQIKEIEYVKNADGTYRLGIADKDGEPVGALPGMDVNKMTLEQVEQAVGKEIAEKIKNEDGKRLHAPDAANKARLLENVDLRIGGEGMAGFYDKILPATVNRLVKKFGARVEQGHVPTGVAKDERWALRDATDQGDGEIVSTHATREAAEREAEDYGGGVEIRELPVGEHVVHSLDITPELRKAAMERGFPLFQGGGDNPRGRITLADNRAIIDLYQSADRSTFMHESGHLWLDELMRDAARGDAPDGLKADRDTVLNWLGVKDAAEIGTPQHEQWAEGFEQYLKTGEAPSSALAKAFAQFRQWLTELYQALARTGQQISPEIKGVMDRLLATDAEIADRGDELNASTREVRKTPRGRAAADPQTWSLFEYLASKGGLKPDPELEAIFGGKRGPMVGGFGPLLRRDGMALDEALRVAKEGHYLFDAADVTGAEARLTPRDLLDTVDRESRGQRVYRMDHVTPDREIPPEEEAKHIVDALHDELEAGAGRQGIEIDPRLEARVVEIVQKEGGRDVLAAYERAIMEDAERYEGLSDARRQIEATRHLPGWDAAEPAAAPQPGAGDRGGGGQAGLPAAGTGAADGGQPRATGAGDRGPGAAQLGRQGAPALDKDAAWKALAQATPEFDAPEIVAASKAADDVPRPPSKLAERVTASEKADAFAKQMYDMFAHRMPEQDRVRLDDLIKRIDDDHEAREIAIVRGGSCLFGVV